MLALLLSYGKTNAGSFEAEQKSFVFRSTLLLILCNQYPLRSSCIQPRASGGCMHLFTKYSTKYFEVLFIRLPSSTLLALRVLLRCSLSSFFLLKKLKKKLTDVLTFLLFVLLCDPGYYCRLYSRRAPSLSSSCRIPQQQQQQQSNHELRC